MSRDAIYHFKLYVAGEADNSAQALLNLNAICRLALPGRFVIDVIDVFKEPDRALADRIFMTPTLVKIGPPPFRRIVGTLSDADAVLGALGLHALAA